MENSAETLQFGNKECTAGDDNRPMNTAPTLHGAVELTHWGLIRAQGQDAAAFLHGQLSNDFKLLDGTRARLAGYCNPKGRLLASLLGWKTAPDDIWLVGHRSILPATVKRLSMFVLRADCRLSDAQQPGPAGDAPPPRLWGLAGDAVQAVLSALPALADPGPPVAWDHRQAPGAGSLVRLPDAGGVARALWVGPALPTTAPTAIPDLSLDLWRWLDVQSGVPTIELSTAEQFVPQMINFELLGGVNFQKGCYPGQEVVARSQYRGTLKRRMFLFDVEAQTPLAKVGQDVFHEDDPGQPAGMVVSLAPRPQGEGSAMLVEVKLAALEGGPLHLGHVDGPPLVQRPLPYLVPLANEASAT
jgi:folate-binding protein YgfZ